MWQDCDREGENIAYEVIDVVKKINKNIKISRAKFSSLNEKEIKHSMENLILPNKNLSDAVELRQKLDLILGYSITRLQTLSLKKIFFDNLNKKELYGYLNKIEKEKNRQNKYKNNENKNKEKGSMYSSIVISYGPCQFPTLNFIVERNEEINKFVSKIFYNMIFNYEKDCQLVQFDWKKGRSFDKENIEEIKEKLKKAFEANNGSIKIENIIKKKQNKLRPFPLNTVELIKLVSRKLNINSSIAMICAEKLYNEGYISYPRTDTQVYTDVHDLNEMLKSLISRNSNSNEENYLKVFNWLPYADRLSENKKKLTARDGKLNDNSHPPISPIKLPNEKSVTANEMKIFNLICVHFLASISDNANGNQTSILMKACDEEFTLNGYEIVNKGYLEIYPYEIWNDKIVPNFKIGEKIEYLKDNNTNTNSTEISLGFSVNEGKTKPPSQMSEAELIDLMHKNGIGTDATIHEHIKNIKSR